MSITLIKGPMFSGKTTELMRLIKREIIAGERVIVYKYVKDDRYGRHFMISSHDNAHYPAVPVDSFAGIDPEPGTVIAIDEGQFIKHLVEFVEKAAAVGCKVLISALNADYQRKLFENIAELIPKCENHMDLKAICFDCKKDASFTKRISNETQQEVIGGSDKYKAVCRKCYFL